MRTFFSGLLLLVATAVMADPRVLNKPVTCDATATVLRTIVEDFKETPQWRGSNPEQGTSTVLTVNPRTGAWTLIEFTAITACVIGVGENSSSAWGVPV